MISLDANISSQVASARVIDVDLGQANRSMMILSGLARPEWRITDDDHIYQQTAIVNLRRTVLAVEQATVTVGLAAIYNDDTQFQFSCDSAELDIDPVSQELLLSVGLSLEGDPSVLNSFGYQVVTVVTTQTTGISGTIRWARDVFDASSLSTGEAAQLFKIAANHVDRIVPPGGFPYFQYTPLAYGAATGFSNDGSEFLVPYAIPGAPYNQPLVITVDVGSNFASNGQPLAGQIAGPNPVVLTVTQSGVAGVDFRVTAIVIK